MSKSPDAFRTISEVADWLGVQAHVLRFWESKFTQVKPIKRAGGRRYYRPADMLLIGGIKKLLHDDGLTIKGVQKILREQGAAFVSDQSRPLDDLTMAELDVSATAEADVIIDAVPEPAETAEVIALNPQSAEDDMVIDDPEPEEEPQDNAIEAADAEPEPEEEPQPEAAPEEDVDASAEETLAQDEARIEAAPEEPPTEAEDPESVPAALPSFVRRPLQDRMVPAPAADDTPADPAQNEAPVTADPEPAAPKPRIIDLPPLPVEAEMPAAPATLSATARLRRLNSDQAKALKPLLAELTQLRDQMAQQTKGLH